MKLKYTTKLFIVVNAIIITFRTLQVLFLTESNTAFLKDGVARGIINVLGTVLVVLALAALFSNSSQAVRQPEKINCKGIPSAVTALLVCGMHIFMGVFSFKGQQNGGFVLAVALLSAASCVVMAVAAVRRQRFSKFAALPFIAFWLQQFILAYMYYSEHPLRVRIVYEIFALCFTVLFFITFGKAVSGVKPEKNFRRIYPLGLTASSLCMASVIPELIATVVGMGDKTAESAVHPLALAAAALFTGFFTINTFKRSNTIHPKALVRRAIRERNRYLAEKMLEQGIDITKL